MQAGARLGGRYRLDRIIGQGGMAVAYLAFDERLERAVVVKLIAPRAASPDATARFAREALLAARIAHPCVTAVYDQGEHEGRPFLVVEYLVGETLGTRLRRDGALAVREAERIALDLCAALGAIHDAGVVHRDLTPDNVFLVARREQADAVKVLDFGLARLLDGDDQLTHTGQGLGSLAYMPPEQLSSAREAGPEADIYAVGCICYEMFTGRRPFRAQSRAELMLAIAYDPPPPLRTLRPDLPEAIGRAVERALAKHTAHRFATAGALGRALVDANADARDLEPSKTAADFDPGPRYALVRQIGAGGFGSVYEVVERESKRRLAAKLLRSMQPEELARFKQEFRLTNSVAHPNVVQPETLHTEAGRWFYTMALIDGLPLDRHLTLHPSRVRACFGDLALAIDAIHRQGLLHLDLKPSNVLVDAGGEVRVLDFGLAQRHGATPDTVAGSARYTAPEVAAGRVEASTDWYAFGVMLDDALCAATAQQASHDDVALHALSLALRAVKGDARPSGAQVLSALQTLTAQARTTAVQEGAFVGRDDELATLIAALRRTRREGALCVLVSGESGVGKSTLLQVFAESTAKIPGAVVLAARCHPTEALPYNAVDAAIDALAKLLRGEPYLWQGDDARGDLARLFPQLRSDTVDSATTAPHAAVDPPEVRHRALSALRTLFKQLAADRPVVLLLDDLQWVDADSVALLSRLIAAPDPPALLIVGSFRSSAVVTESWAKLLDRLQRDLACLELPVRALDAQAGTALALQLGAGAMHYAAAAAIAASSGGNPFFIHELVRHALTTDTDSAHATFESALRVRIERQTAGARRVLELACVALAPLARRIALAAADGAPPECITALDAAHLVQRVIVDGEVLLEPYHDRIRVVVVGMLDAATLRARHQALVDVLLKAPDEASELLAHHLSAAGDAQAAVAHAVRAAEHAEHALAFERAAELYRLALELGVGDAQTRVPLLQGRARALIRAGSIATAGRLLLDAAETATHAEQQVELRRLGGEQLLLSGDLHAGLDALAPELHAHGLRVADDAFAAITEAFTLVAPLLEQGIPETPPPPRARHPGTPTELHRLDLCLTLARSLTQIDLRAMPFIMRALSLALALGEPSRLQRALAFFVFGTAGAFPNPLVAPALDLCRRLANTLRDPYADALCALADIEVLHFSGDFLAAEAACERAERLLLETCTDVSRELGYVRGSALVIQYSQKGDYRSLAPRSLQWLAEADARGDLFHANWLRAAHALLWVAHDEPARARAELAIAEASWPGGAGVFETAVSLYLDVIDRYEDRPVEALQPAQGRASVLGSPAADTPFLKGYLCLHRAWCALRTLVADAPAEHEARAQLVTNIDALRALGLPSWTATADAFEANLHAQEGRTAQALDHLDRAERTFRQLHMLALAACAHRRRGELSSGELRLRLVDDADRELRDLGVKRPERFAGAYFSVRG